MLSQERGRGRPAGEDARVRSGLQQIGLPVAGNHGARQHAPGPGSPGQAAWMPGALAGEAHRKHRGVLSAATAATWPGSMPSQPRFPFASTAAAISRCWLANCWARCSSGGTLGTKTEPEQLADQHDGQPEPQQNLPEQTSLEDHRILYPMLRTVSMVTASPPFAAVSASGCRCAHRRCDHRPPAGALPLAGRGCPW